MGEQKNLVLAGVLIFGLMVFYQLFVIAPAQKERSAAQQIAQETAKQIAVEQAVNAQNPIKLPRSQTRRALAAAPKISVQSDGLHGSISTYGGRFNDLLLNEYRKEMDPNSAKVRVLAPKLVKGGEFAMFGWRAADDGANNTLPGLETEWQIQSGRQLTPATPVVLSFTSAEGLVFTRTIEMDDQYMFTITDQVVNTGTISRTLRPYGQVRKYGDPMKIAKNASPAEKRKQRGSFVSHQGMVGATDGKDFKKNYKKLRKSGETYTGKGGWIGFTSKYWLNAVIAPADEQVESKTRMFTSASGEDVFEVQFLAAPREIAPGSTQQVQLKFFSGAKEVKALKKYQQELGIDRFDMAIDWGLFAFLTRPYFVVLDWLYGIVGNFGLAIMAFTVLIKALFFPLANKSYASMARMKALQPKLEELKELYPDDAQKMQQETMALYKREKVNPFGGCLPILLQIPVFFALYKTLYISLEMRHAPFFGWIQDLSAPDPTAFGNLFGLLPYDPANVPLIGAVLAVGVWPLIMGITMAGQQMLNPPAPDRTQRIIFSLMPILFTVMMAPFAAGLVIYWSWNNFLSLIQQYIITRKNGVATPLDKWLGKAGGSN